MQNSEYLVSWRIHDVYVHCRKGKKPYTVKVQKLARLQLGSESPVLVACSEIWTFLPKIKDVFAVSEWLVCLERCYLNVNTDL